MNNFPWYEELGDSDSLTQGDILLSCDIPSPGESLYDSIIGNDDGITPEIDIYRFDAIILSQACDIENDKIDSLVVCPTWPLSTLMKENQYYQSSSARESLRQGKEPAYHLLNEYDSETLKFDFSVVDFHRIYSLPKRYLEQVARDKKHRLRLMPPYREHLSQAFARYFMRVGLPVDIERSQVKQYTVPA